MLKNHLKIALRTLIKHKGYSFINIAGLAIGMACCILILLWVQHELSFDRFHPNADDIYRVYQDVHHAGGVMPFSNLPMPLAPEIESSIPEIRLASRLAGDRVTIKYGAKIFNETGIYYTDPSLFEIFSFPFVLGDFRTALSDPYSILLTEAAAEKYFGSENPLGKVLTLDEADQMKVTGLLNNPPDNSSLQFDFLVPFTLLEAGGYDTSRWDSSTTQTYVLANRGIAADQIEQKISGILLQHNQREESYLRLQPLKKLRLYTLSGEPGNMKSVYIFSLIALFVLVIACINFMNLATARSSKRAREVGLRKVVGAKRTQIVRQFFGEAVFLTLIAFALSLLLVELLLPLFNRISGKPLSLDFSGNIIVYGSLLGVALFTGLLSGSYPALYLSSFLPVKVLKSSFHSGSSSSMFRKGLVIFQFSLSIMLIIGTGVISSQLRYIQKRDIGFDRENLVYFNINDTISQNFDSVKDEILKNAHILNVTRTFQIPSYNRYSSPADWEGKGTGQNINFNISIVDEDYLQTLGLELAQGRNFSQAFSTDTSNYILNQEAVNQMGLEEPLGKRFTLGNNTGEIIGVIKDYNYMPFTYEIQPLVWSYTPVMFRYAMVRISGQNIPETIGHIENTWSKFAPDFPFEYHFLMDDYQSIYSKEKRMEELFVGITIMAVFISCLGLFGLASFTAEQRTKEIGVRKVLGASVAGIASLLSKEFLKWVTAANLIAWPVAYLAMRGWLRGFAYKIDMGLTVFLFAAVLALLIALATVSFQAIRAAMGNPIKALRYE
jgi:putative ABC transport system permease protein